MKKVKTEIDPGSHLHLQIVFSVVVITQRLDLGVLSVKRKSIILLEIWVTWEENIDAQDRKETRCEELMNACRKKGCKIK